MGQFWDEFGTLLWCGTVKYCVDLRTSHSDMSIVLCPHGLDCAVILGDLWEFVYPCEGMCITPLGADGETRTTPLSHRFKQPWDIFGPLVEEILSEVFLISSGYLLIGSNLREPIEDDPYTCEAKYSHHEYVELSYGHHQHDADGEYPISSPELHLLCRFTG